MLSVFPRMGCPLRLIVLSLLLSAVSAAPLMAAEPTAQTAAASPLVIGETFTIKSKALGETRRINVYRPQPWGLDPKTPLPVLYMPDGGIGEDFLHVAGEWRLDVAQPVARGDTARCLRSELCSSDLRLVPVVFVLFFFRPPTVRRIGFTVVAAGYSDARLPLQGKSLALFDPSI